MPYTQSVRLPQITIEALKSQITEESGKKPNISKAMREVMHTFTDNPSEVLNALARKAARPIQESDAPPKTTSVTADPNLCKQFMQIARLYDYSFDTLLKIGIEDRLYH